jgi:hypothetical protein
MGSNVAPRSIDLKRGIGYFFSPHLDGGILHNANDRRNIREWSSTNSLEPQRVYG